MALTKLTLTVDRALVEKARRYGREHGTSISRMVGRCLAALPDGEEAEYTPIVRGLMGLLPPDVDEAGYRRHLEERYGR